MMQEAAAVLRLTPDHRALSRAGLLRMRRSRSRRVDGGRGVCAVVIPQSERVFTEPLRAVASMR